MLRHRIAAVFVLGVAALALAGCSGATTTSWQPGIATTGGAAGAMQSAKMKTAAVAPTGNELTMTMTGDSTVALTFDDGPSSYTPEILAMLRQHRAKATFCLVGVQVKEFPEMVRQIVQDGHTLCNHTWGHDLNLGRKGASAIRADLEATNAEIRKAVPDAQIKYFRHPGGNFTQDAVGVAAEMGMASIGWDVDPRDWDSTLSGATLTNHIVQTLRTKVRPGSIVLSHDAGGDRTCTMAAYRQMLPELAAKFTLAALPN
jgi:peptidoglycan-N-acetylglucosamine deacetylase